LKPLIESRTDRPARHFIEGVTVPPAVHVGLTEAESSATEGAAEKAPIVNMKVPGALPVKKNIRRSE
jgi:hypothetical protein